MQDDLGSVRSEEVIALQKPAPADTLPTRVSLLNRLRDLEDSRSWDVFVAQYQQRVISIARSRGLRNHEAEEVAHEVFKRVARTIGTYQARPHPGSFRSWLFQLTRWRVTDQLRERHKSPAEPMGSRFPHRSSDDNNQCPPTIERIPAAEEHEDAFEAESRQHLIAALLKRAQSVVPPRQLQIFQMLILDEVPPSRVAQIFGMSAAAVYVIKHRVTARLREELAGFNRVELAQD
jgi:RNA polymerase sigma factor (sigma-70 family)